MFITALLRPRLIASVALALVIGSSAYGFAAANTVSSTSAGAGQGAISGYVTNTVDYTLDATDPSLINTITFNLYLEDGTTSAPNTSTVRAQFLDNSNAAHGGIYTCTAGTLPQWSCTTSGTKASVATVEQLRVIATE